MSKTSKQRNDSTKSYTEYRTETLAKDDSEAVTIPISIPAIYLL